MIHRSIVTYLQTRVEPRTLDPGKDVDESIRMPAEIRLNFCDSVIYPGTIVLDTVHILKFTSLVMLRFIKTLSFLGHWDEHLACRRFHMP